MRAIYELFNNLRVIFIFVLFLIFIYLNLLF